MKNDINIDEYSGVKWRTLLKCSIDRFKEDVCDDEQMLEHFDDTYLEKITAKYDRNMALTYKLSTVHYFLSFMLFLSLGKSNVEFEILWLSAVNIYENRAFVIITISFLTCLTGLLTIHTNYIKLFSSTLIERKYPAKIARYIRYKYFDEYFDFMSKAGANSSRHPISKSVVFLFAFVLIIILLAVLSLSVFMKIAIIVDLLQNPLKNTDVHLIAVSTIVISFLFQFSLLALQLPLPEFDLSSFEKLDKLKDEDEEQYNLVLRRLNEKRLKKENRTAMVISVTVFTLIVLFKLYDFESHMLVYEGLRYYLIPIFLIVSTFISMRLVKLFNSLNGKYLFTNANSSSDVSPETCNNYKRNVILIAFGIPFLVPTLSSMLLFWNGL